MEKITLVEAIKAIMDEIAQARKEFVYDWEMNFSNHDEEIRYAKSVAEAQNNAFNFAIQGVKCLCKQETDYLRSAFNYFRDAQDQEAQFGDLQAYKNLTNTLNVFFRGLVSKPTEKEKSDAELAVSLFERDLKKL